MLVPRRRLGGVVRLLERLQPREDTLRLRPVEIPFATENMLENTGGVPTGVLSGRQPATFYLC